MAENSFSYCDSDEEVFFGKVTEKELLKQALLGQNYESPAVKLNTSRAKSSMRSQDSANLPDILSESGNKIMEAEEVPVDLKEFENSLKSIPISPVNSSSNQSVADIVVIDVDGQSDSLQIISDDESFIKNEERLKHDSYKSMSIINPFPTESIDCDFENKAVANANIQKNIEPGYIETLIQASVTMQKEFDNHCEAQDKKNNPVTDNVEAVFSNIEYSLLNNVSDSILNISHISSLSSPGMEHVKKHSLEIQTKNILYEDISCDGEQIMGIVSENSKSPSDDLHMSVDDISDHQQLDHLDNISQPSLYKSCLSNCNNSTYCTAQNVSNMSQACSRAFQDYRENINDSFSCLEIDKINGIETNVKNEASVVVVENLDNSPLASPSTITNNGMDDTKHKTISKLPVYHGTSSLLKPPKLNVKIGSSTTSNYKWAKNLPKLAINKTSSSLGRNEPNQTYNCKDPCTRFAPTTNVTKVKQNQIEFRTPNVKTGSQIINKAKTPGNYKIPLQSMKLIKSDTKIPTTPRPVAKGSATSGKKKDISTPSPNFQVEKNRYKDVISPVRAYISGDPTVLTKIPQYNSSKKNSSHIPLKLSTPLKDSKVIQRLHYGSPKGQENVDPNYKRDTLPPRVLSDAEAVFFKDPELPKKRLPKMGESMQKLLDTPRPKLTIHQGRVKSPPKTKGVLIPNINSPQDSSKNRISVRVIKSPVKVSNME